MLRQPLPKYLQAWRGRSIYKWIYKSCDGEPPCISNVEQEVAANISTLHYVELWKIQMGKGRRQGVVRKHCYEFVSNGWICHYLASEEARGKRYKLSSSITKAWGWGDRVTEEVKR